MTLPYPLIGKFELTKDIDASMSVNWKNGDGLSIGQSSAPFMEF
jgi:hypothetical protein